MSSAPAAAAGVTFSATSYDVSGNAPAARIVVRRVGSTTDDVPFVWWTEAASAKPDVDYAPLGRRVELIPKGRHTVTIFVPIISNPLRQQPTEFYVALGELPDSGEAGRPSERATVTIAPTG
ncbi:MAG TPA: Calx-beta domain-containing protein [Acetobacteraceae bacterium]|nr:Calx-beta domain-containing protein [Acetobacteraceae bacterium]